MDRAGGDVIRPRLIDHIVLRTTRVDRLVAFYTGVLGCTVERTLPGEIGLTQLRAGASLIDVVDVDSELGRAGGGPPSVDGNNLDHFCLAIEAIAEADLRDWLRKRGVKPGELAERYGGEGFGPSLYIRDPDGNTVELRPAPATGEHDKPVARQKP
jgi:glyoxylase I family protein